MGRVGDEHKSEFCREDGLRRIFRGNPSSIIINNHTSSDQPASPLQLFLPRFAGTIMNIFSPPSGGFCSAPGSSMLIMLVDLFTGLICSCLCPARASAPKDGGFSAEDWTAQLRKGTKTSNCWKVQAHLELCFHSRGPENSSQSQKCDGAV